MKKYSFLAIFTVIMFIAFSGCTESPQNNPPSTATPAALEAGSVAHFTLLQTTDVHDRASGVGRFTDYSPKDDIDNSGGTGSAGDSDLTEGGYARIATAIARARLEKAAAGIPVVLVDSGDFLMGTAYDMTADDPAAFKFMESMKYDAITIGNHEFDWGPAGLALMINNAMGSNGKNFTVPIIATNMVTDGVTGTDDDGMEALKAAQVIQSTKLMTLANGLKIGIIGLMGPNADTYSPAAPPVTFNHQTSFIQAQVDDLKNNQEADIVIALSHSGIINPNSGSPTGDDIALAGAVTGIDIIASGHEHQKTDNVVTVGSTSIICAGHYGRNLADLDVTYTKGTGITDLKLTNIPINDNIPGDPSMNFVVDAYNKGIDSAIAADGLSMSGTVGAATFDLLYPTTAVESSMGNLVADAVRSPLAASGVPGVIGIVATGVIRDNFLTGAISFADLYNVLPLGMTNATDQTSIIPGYPLLYTLLSGSDVKKLIWVSLNVPTALGSADYFLNFSGIKYSYGWVDQSHPEYGLEAKTTTLVSDPVLGTEAGAIGDSTLYPVVVDLYLLLMMPQLDAQLTALGYPALGITPLAPAGSSMGSAMNLTDSSDPAYYLNFRLDADTSTDGIQEVKEWQALLQYLGALGTIPDAYKAGGSAMGRKAP